MYEQPHPTSGQCNCLAIFYIHEQFSSVFFPFLRCEMPSWGKILCEEVAQQKTFVKIVHSQECVAIIWNSQPTLPNTCIHMKFTTTSIHMRFTTAVKCLCHDLLRKCQEYFLTHCTAKASQTLWVCYEWYFLNMTGGNVSYCLCTSQELFFIFKLWTTDGISCSWSLWSVHECIVACAYTIHVMNLSVIHAAIKIEVYCWELFVYSLEITDSWGVHNVLSVFTSIFNSF